MYYYVCRTLKQVLKVALVVPLLKYMNQFERTSENRCQVHILLQVKLPTETFNDLMS